MNFPTHCEECGVFLMGGATRHLRTCGFYPLSYIGMMETEMPLLDKDALADLRQDQARAAKEHRLCQNCTAQLWPNYCRECDEHFTDGHYVNCKDRSEHSAHRKY